jgi:hypothetical protein
MQKNKNSLSFSILAILYIAVLAWIFYWQIPNIKLYSDRCVKAQNDIATSQEILSQSISVKNFYSETQNDIKKADSLFADKEAPLVFINFLEKLATESNVAINISAGNSADKSSADIFDFYSLQSTLMGQSKDIIKFMERLENSPYLLNIQSLDFSQSTDLKLGKIESKAVIMLKVYAKK